MRRSIALLFAAGLPLAAQWDSFQRPGVPRNADGSPNLDAPAPRLADGKPDLSGMWSFGMGAGYTLNIAADQNPDFALPWAAAYYKRQMEDLGKNDPNTIGCLPAGPRRITGGGLAKIIHTPALMAILSEDLTYRQIFLDGRTLPKDPQPSFMGYSVGRWDGDTLVVETSGFNERTWLDMGGHPHTDALRTVERFRRTAFGRMELSVSLEDPKAYRAPWTVQVNARMSPDTEFIEYICTESQQSAHIVGRTGEEQGVKLAPVALAKYTGVYESASPRRVYRIALVDGELYLDIDGKGNIPFVPLGENRFSPRLGGDFVFFTDASGKVTHLISYGADDVITAIKR